MRYSTGYDTFPLTILFFFSLFFDTSLAYLDDNNCVSNFRDADSPNIFLMFLDAEAEVNGDIDCVRRLHRLRMQPASVRDLGSTKEQEGCKSRNPIILGSPSRRCLFRVDCTRILVQDIYSRSHPKDVSGCSVTNSTLLEFTSEVDLNSVNLMH